MRIGLSNFVPFNTHIDEQNDFSSSVIDYLWRNSSLFEFRSIYNLFYAFNNSLQQRFRPNKKISMEERKILSNIQISILPPF